MAYIKKEDIERFIINDDLEILKAKLNSFNPFKILKVQDFEIRHSNILSWLLDPSENHNFDDRILKRFVIKTIQKANFIDYVVINKYDDIYKLQNMNFYDSKVYREKDNIDILVVSEMNKVVILIENKIKSGEKENQLVKYLNEVKKDYLNYDIIPIYLTVDESEPSCHEYYTATYEDIIDSIEFMINNYKDRTSFQVIEFIKFYITIIKEKYYMDKELKDLCKKIYFENKEVIDAIYSVGNDIDIDTAIDAFNNEFKDVEKKNSNSRIYWFYNDELKKTKSIALDSNSELLVYYWFRVYNDHIRMVLEIGQFKNPEKRKEFFDELKKNGIKVNDKKVKIDSKSNRVYSDMVKLKDITDKDEIKESMIALYNKEERKKFEKIVIDTFNQFNW